MLYDSILTDGNKYGVTDLLKTTRWDKSLANITKSDNDTLVSFGLHSPFSNF